MIERILPLVPRGEVHDGLAVAAALRRREPIERVASRLGNGSRVTAQDTVPFAIWSAARRLDNFVEALWTTVSVTGDMDTNAAIVGGIVALFVGEKGIPPRWVRNREPLPLSISEG